MFQNEDSLSIYKIKLKYVVSTAHFLYTQLRPEEAQGWRLLRSERPCLQGVGVFGPVIDGSSEKRYLNEISNIHRRLCGPNWIFIGLSVVPSCWFPRKPELNCNHFLSFCAWVPGTVPNAGNVIVNK